MPELSCLTLMLLLIIAFPWLGIYLMEQGAPGLNILQIGAPNGATRAYGWYVLVGSVVYLILYTSLQPRPRQHRVGQITRRAMRRVASVVIIVNLVALVFLYAGVGASEVLAGRVGKGEFRSAMGALGPFAYFLRDFLLPMLCALVGWSWRRCHAGTVERLLFATTILLTASYSALWGYKAAAILTLVPTFLVVWPRLRLSYLIVFAVSAGLSTLGFAMLFDRLSFTQAVEFIMWRATVGSGDTLWRLWDLHLQGDPFAPYLPTWLQALGGRLGAVVADLSRTNPDQLMQTDFSALATTIVKDYDPSIDALRSNVTSTVFGEGLIALGSPGYLVFAALAGVVVALTRTWLEHAMAMERPLLTIVAANYMGFSVLGWLNSGGVIVLFNVPHVVSFGLAIAIGALILGYAGLGRARPR